MFDILINVLNKPMFSYMGSDSSIWVQCTSSAYSSSNSLTLTLYHVFGDKFNSSEIGRKSQEWG